MLKSYSAVAALAGALALGALAAYALQNDSGHTGFSPYWALALFIPVALIGLVQVSTGRRLGVDVGMGILALLIGLAGIGFLVYLDQSNTLLQYEVWLARGMP